MKTVRAYAATEANGSFEPFEYEPGDLAPDEVEIDVAYCGICHSDLSMLKNDWMTSVFPRCSRSSRARSGVWSL